MFRYFQLGFACWFPCGSTSEKAAYFMDPLNHMVETLYRVIYQMTSHFQGEEENSKIYFAFAFSAL